MAGSTGFVRAGGRIWLLAPGAAFRPEGDGIVAIPWRGEAERPHRLASGEALWMVHAATSPVPCHGPDLTPDWGAGGGVPDRPRHFHASDAGAVWYGLHGGRRAVMRMDGREPCVPREALNRLPLDVAPVPGGAALLYPGRLVRHRNGQASELRLGTGRGATILCARSDELWIRDGDSTVHVAGDEVERVPHPLEYAGDAFAVREGSGLRILGGPEADRNALRDARHVFVDGNRVWVATADAIRVVEGAAVRTHRNDAPSLPRPSLLAEVGGRAVVVSAADGAGAAIDEYDGGWRRQARLPGEFHAAAADGEEVWVAAGRMLHRWRGGEGRVESLRFDFEPCGLAAGGGHLAAWDDSRMLWRRAGVVAWDEIPAVRGSHDWVSDVALIDGLVTAALVMGCERVIVRWNGRWERLAPPEAEVFADAVLGSRAAWATHHGRVLRWAGGTRVERWRIEVPYPASLVAAGDAIVWLQGSDGLIFASAATRTVHRVGGLWAGSAAVRDGAGACWRAVARGVNRVGPEEISEVGRLVPEAPIRAGWRHAERGGA
jgi:hypothetical protein